MKKTLQVLAAAVIAIASITSARATLYSNTFGAQLAGLSNCDDCADGPFSFMGAGQRINYFGTSYSGLFVSTNGYVTFGGGASNFVSRPLNTQTILPMIAGSFTDLDSRGDAASNVYINNSTPGQLVATWEAMGHYSNNYTGRSTFQLVVRSDQFRVALGEGQVGFFYGAMTDPSITSAGFGDGLATVNPGEVAFLSLADGTQLNNNAPRWYNLAGGLPVTIPNRVPEPGGLALFGLAAVGLGLMRRRAQGVKFAATPQGV